MTEWDVAIVGGGAAGFFAAITCAEKCPGKRIVLLEKSPKFLSKVRISGGGRCNVTHACFEPRALAEYYPRGGRELVGPFHQFQPRDTIEWFETRGVKLKTEEDGRIFPITDSSQTVIDCLMQAVETEGVELVVNRGPERVRRSRQGGFELEFKDGETLHCGTLMLATGGCRTPQLGGLPVSLGHTLESPVPSLFTFHIGAPWLTQLAGISVPAAEVSVPGTGFKERGAMLITHAGLSGPAVLKLSAWGARALHEKNYTFPLLVNWLAERDADELAREMDARRAKQPGRFIVNSPVSPLATRLWESLVLAAGIPHETRWAELSRAARHQLLAQLSRMEFQVSGKTLNKDEFVTCGGVRLKEVDFKTMESRVCPGLFLAGELLDIDGLTGGFNFQSAWTTGWLAGMGMAAKLVR